MSAEMSCVWRELPLRASVSGMTSFDVTVLSTTILYVPNATLVALYFQWPY